MSRPRRRLLWSVYLVAVAQLAVAGAAIFVVQRTLERAPWQYEPARHKSTVDGFGEFFDTPEALGRHIFSLLAPPASDAPETAVGTDPDNRGDDELYALIDSGYL